MARDFSSQYLEQLNFPKLPALHLRLRAQRAIGAVRRAERALAPAGRRESLPVSGECLFSEAFDRARAHLADHDWAFCRGVLDADFHARLHATWPKRRFMEPASSLVKSWDRGFDWRRGSADPAYLEQHPALQRLLDHLRSEAFAQRFSDLVGHSVSCYSFTVTMTVPGSVVAPHRDDWAFLDKPEAAYNMVLFVDGAGGSRSGGLSILATNTFDDVIFESTELRNTALIYDTKAPFYHGFEPVARGKFRWAIITNFVSPDY